MKVNTDALLLGGWISGLALSDCLRILDVGTGTGIIALMLAQAYPEATVHALDISPEALMDARVNFLQSTYADRLEVQQQDFLLYDSDEKYDLIVSNPHTSRQMLLLVPSMAVGWPAPSLLMGWTWRALCIEPLHCFHLMGS